MISKNKDFVDLDIKKTFIKLDQKISDALNSLTNSECKICIVVDKNKCFIIYFLNIV